MVSPALGPILAPPNLTQGSQLTLSSPRKSPEPIPAEPRGVGKNLPSAPLTSSLFLDPSMRLKDEGQSGYVVIREGKPWGEDSGQALRVEMAPPLHIAMHQ